MQLRMLVRLSLSAQLVLVYEQGSSFMFTDIHLPPLHKVYGYFHWIPTIIDRDCK